MGKQSKVKVLEVLQVQGKEIEDFKGMIFKVQVRKGAQPEKMTYDQLKYCYPSALIDFYESKSDFFNQLEESEQFDEDESDLLDYDQHTFVNGSKVLEYVNSLTYCRPVRQKKSTGQFENVRVYQKQTQFFYENFIANDYQTTIISKEVKKEGTHQV